MKAVWHGHGDPKELMDPRLDVATTMLVLRARAILRRAQTSIIGPSLSQYSISSIETCPSLYGVNDNALIT